MRLLCRPLGLLTLLVFTEHFHIEDLSGSLQKPSDVCGTSELREGQCQPGSRLAPTPTVCLPHDAQASLKEDGEED